jgi:ABC-type transport system involved in multi-copper enzyme maturation permease subunit
MGRDARACLGRLLVLAFLLELMLVPAVLYWPIFEENVAFAKNLVPFLKGKDVLGMVEVTGFSGYVIAQHFMKGCLFGGVLGAVLFSMNAVAGEARRGTLEIWLARPLSRRRILLERWIQGALALVVPIFLTSLTIPWLATFVEETVAYRPLLLSSVHVSGFLLATYSLTFCLSCLGRQPTWIGGGVLALVLVQSAMYIIEILTHWSVLRTVDIPRYVAIFESGRLDGSVLGPTYAVALGLLVASLAIFERRTP